MFTLTKDCFHHQGSPRHRMDQKTGALHITMVTQDDIGQYTCIANTTGQALVQSNGAYLRVKSKILL